MIDESPRPGRTLAHTITTYQAQRPERRSDDIVTEEPLELRLLAGNQTQSLAVTMRTPGNDFELAAGFAIAESIIRNPSEIAEITYCLAQHDAEQRYNIVNIRLRSSSMPDVTRFERHFTMSSACGICGRASLHALCDLGIEPIHDRVRLPISRLYTLPAKMRAAQPIFTSTGGLHAAALFTSDGALLAVREDIGRHNALDKLVGWGALAQHLPFSDRLLCVSGRASYEILQKAVVARIPVVCSISAPSTLAIALAEEFNITLVGFLRDERANVYAGAERLTST